MCHMNTTASLNQTNPRLFYYSTSYGWTYGIRQYTAAVNILRKFFPHAGIGANFSPNPDYVGSSHQFVECIRDGCLTMPWSEPLRCLASTAQPCHLTAIPLHPFQV
jgi:hypothetical protein